MGNENAARRKQREFLFLFNAETRNTELAGIIAKTDPVDTRWSSSFDNEEASTLRKRLISELKEFGC